MKAHITKDEMRLLVYLHEIAKGYGELFCIRLKDAAAALNVTVPQLSRHVSYLVEHELAGMITANRISPGESAGWRWIEAIYLTGKGEDYVREVEAEPGVARKLTVAALEGVWEVAKDAAAEILAGYVLAQKAP